MECQAWNKILQVFLIFVVFLFNKATSDIDDSHVISKRNAFGKADTFAFREWIKYLDIKPLRLVEDHTWKSPQNVGQISGVSVDLSGNPVIFHRGDRIWGYDTFSDDNVYQEEYKGPITVNTVLTLDKNTGDVISGWGNRTFYLPHGMHIDGFGNVWLTDVALHQVFKYDSSGVLKFTLGQRFEPGNDNWHFCQPTSVAVAPTGEFVVADGYCNRRILLFNSMGHPLYAIDDNLGVHMNIPHSVTILPDGKVCVADRENERILCLNVRPVATPGSSMFSIPILGRVFAVASHHDFIYAVNGLTSRNRRTIGFTINPITQSIVDFWSPEYGSFRYPHDIGICPNGTALYVAEIGPNRVWKFNSTSIEKYWRPFNRRTLVNK